MLELAVSSLTYEGFGYTDCSYLFENAYANGYRNVEFNSWHALSLTKERMQFLKAGCEKHGLKPISIHTAPFGGNTGEEIAWNTAHKLRAIEAAVELGCRRVVANVSGECKDRAAVIEELNAIAPYAEDLGVLICLENRWDSVAARTSDYEEILGAVPSRMIGACLDGGHMEAAGERIENFIEKINDRINHLHLKENLVFGQKTFCRFGSGGTDNGKMIQMMKDRGFSGYMSVELSPEIGETGASVAFTNDDRRKAIELYSEYEVK